MKNFRFILAGAFMLAGTGVEAHDFSATVNGQRLYFDITSKTGQTAAVTFNGSISDKKEIALTGKVEIPAKIKHGDVVYKITAVGPKAFAGAGRLKGIVIPAGVEKIGDFAFEGCDSLASVVFPGNAVSLGQGVFFKCRGLSGITIGSDWKTIDLAMFRWSDRLSEITIPAKTEKIKGLKKLKALKNINVDPNNGNFASKGGLLYSKDGKTLYACPRAYAGKLKIDEGTETVTTGALADCMEVTGIDFPASLQKLSFRETSRLEKLETVVMRPDIPVMTAYRGGRGVFLLQIANEKTEMVIPSSGRKAYEKALAADAGEYSETPAGTPYMVTAQEMPAKKNLKGIKNIDKY